MNSVCPELDDRMYYEVVCEWKLSYDFTIPHRQEVSYLVQAKDATAAIAALRIRFDDFKRKADGATITGKMTIVSVTPWKQAVVLGPDSQASDD